MLSTHHMVAYFAHNRDNQLWHYALLGTIYATTPRTNPAWFAAAGLSDRGQSVRHPHPGLAGSRRIRALQLRPPDRRTPPLLPGHSAGGLGSGVSQPADQ